MKADLAICQHTHGFASLTMYTRQPYCSRIGAAKVQTYTCIGPRLAPRASNNFTDCMQAGVVGVAADRAEGSHQRKKRKREQLQSAPPAAMLGGVQWANPSAYKRAFRWGFRGHTAIGSAQMKICPVSVLRSQAYTMTATNHEVSCSMAAMPLTTSPPHCPLPPPHPHKKQKGILVALGLTAAATIIIINYTASRVSKLA